MQFMKEVLTQRDSEGVIQSTCGGRKHVGCRALGGPCSAEMGSALSLDSFKTGHTKIANSISTEICPWRDHAIVPYRHAIFEQSARSHHELCQRQPGRVRPPLWAVVHRHAVRRWCMNSRNRISQSKTSIVVDLMALCTVAFVVPIARRCVKEKVIHGRICGQRTDSGPQAGQGVWSLFYLRGPPGKCFGLAVFCAKLQRTSKPQYQGTTRTRPRTAASTT